MRFSADSLAVLSWEADAEGNKIPGTEEQLGAGTQIGVSDFLDFIRLVEARALRTSEDRYVIGELWEVDSGRPSMRIFGTGRPMKRRGRRAVNKDSRYRGRLRQDA